MGMNVNEEMGNERDKLKEKKRECIERGIHKKKECNLPIGN